MEQIDGSGSISAPLFLSHATATFSSRPGTAAEAVARAKLRRIRSFCGMLVLSTTGGAEGYTVSASITVKRPWARGLPAK